MGQRKQLITKVEVCSLYRRSAQSFLGDLGRLDIIGLILRRLADEGGRVGSRFSNATCGPVLMWG